MSIKHQKGLTLLEAIVSLGILSAVVAGTATLLSQYSSATQNNVAAQHMKTIADATQAYIRDNYSAVMATATATTPTLIRVSTLQGSGHLAAGVSETNNFGQRVCALVLEPSAGQLNALVVSEGGTTIDDISVAGIAGALGAGGGAVYSSDTTTIRGAMGGWSTAIGNFASANNLGQLCNGSAGTIPIAAGHPMVALWFNGGDATAGTLYRSSVPGRPELNTMNTPIFMSASTVQTVGGACTSTGAIGRDAAGAVVSCQGGTWKGGSGGLNWKGSVANVASLPASGNASGDAYRITGLSNHIFVWDAQSSVWQGLVVNSAGTLTLPGIIVAQGSNSSYGAITIQGAKNGYSGINFKDAGGNNVGTLMMSPTYAGFFNSADGAWHWYVDSSGNSVQAGQAQMGTAYLTTVVTINTACSPNGRVARDANGLLLSCQSGLWAKAQGGGDLGTWSFNIATYGTPQIGQGIYDSSSSTFSGTTWYNTTGGGRNGQVSCSNSPYCVYYYTADGGGACTYAWCGAGIGCDHVCYFRATVKNLPVYGAVKID